MAVHMQDRRYVARAAQTAHTDPLTEHQAVLGIIVSVAVSLPAWAGLVWAFRAAL